MEPEKLTILASSKEKRYIRKIKTTPECLKKFLFTPTKSASLSLGMMLITSDCKAVLLKRTASFLYPLVKKNSLLLNDWIVDALYPSEISELASKTPFPKSAKGLSPIYIFPGGHSNKNEFAIHTLLRELKEETSINFYLNQLKFHQTYFFEVVILDLMIMRRFRNLVFPVKVDLTSREIARNFKETKHTRDPLFVDIFYCQDLVQALLTVQNIMLLK
ncbi:hypothetical protein DH26_gp080 [Chloriridovirus anopheles1]|uniref:Nudix hydrolase domain-containing protein n=1 Tax=Chloriridovirus anopheles1 TaxID=1465751 RepID=W8QN14_9VIRU|nr:hypothetical protein DH26_gp080 [Anopheles minimus iridovirus]AHL67573.1 hypothetical protein AMIV_080 [Anopheles minimus iridovirus]